MEQKKVNLLNSLLLPVVKAMVKEPETIKISTFSTEENEYCLIGMSPSDYNKTKNHTTIVSDLEVLANNMLSVNHYQPNLTLKIVSI